MQASQIKSTKSCGSHADCERQLLSSLRKLIRTREMQETLGALIPELMELWAGKHFLKKKIVNSIGNGVRKNLQQQWADNQENENRLGDAFADVVGSLITILQLAAEDLQAVSMEEKETRLKQTVSQFCTERTGRILTCTMKSLHDIHTKNPTAVAEAILPAIHSWIKHTDFGTLREAADTMGPEVEALAAGINAILWQYPSKLVLALSFLPDLLNLLIVSLTETIAKFNQASPDLIADILFSLARSVNATSLGKALCELTELTRKIHTGSTLIGDPGSSRFQQEIQQVITAIIAQLDSRVYWFTRVAAKQGSAVMAQSLRDAVAEKPAFIIEGLKTFAARKNPGIHAKRRGLETLDDISAEEMSAAMADGLADLDLQELGEVVNLSCVLINRLMALKPELLPNLAEQVTASLDMDEIEDAVQRALQVGAEKCRPVLRAVLPDILNELTRILEPADDAYEEKMAKARMQLRSLLMGEATAS